MRKGQGFGSAFKKILAISDKIIYTVFAKEDAYEK